MRTHVLWCVLAGALAAGPAPAEDAIAPATPRRAWVGLKVVLVPPAVCAQLCLDGRGVMVRNVVKDSPADRAGLRQYDVIVGVDGGNVSDDLDKFASAVQARRSGEEVSLTIIREARRMALALKLGEPPAAGAVEYVYPAEPAPQAAPHVGLLKQGAQGWIIITPGGTVSVTGAVKAPAIAKPPKVLVTTLPAQAPKAVQKPAQPKTPGAVKAPKPAEPSTAPAAPKPAPAATSKTFIFRTAPAAPAAPAGQGGKLSMDELEQRLREMVAKSRGDATTARIEVASPVAVPPPGPQFTIASDGRITARLTEGGSTVTSVYASAEEMKSKAPKLYEQFRKLLDAGGK